MGHLCAANDPVRIVQDLALFEAFSAASWASNRAVKNRPTFVVCPSVASPCVPAALLDIKAKSVGWVRRGGRLAGAWWVS